MKQKPCALLKRTASVYDGALRAAFVAADLDATGKLSKRQLYAALARVDLAVSASEQLAIWKELYAATGGKSWTQCSANYTTPCDCSALCDEAGASACSYRY